MISQGSIRRIETGNPRLYGYEVSGKIRKEDVEWMARSVEPALELPGKIDMIIIMSDYEGMELGAAFDAQSLKTQAKSATEIRKYAVVGAPAWAEAMINMMSPLSPVEARTFDLSQTGEAWAWVRS